MGYNPADYAAVQNKAKAMGKPELEKYYTNDKNKKHDPLFTFFKICIIVGLGLLFFVMILIIDNFPNVIQEISNSVAKEVCPISNEIYISAYSDNSVYNFEVDCSTYKG